MKTHAEQRAEEEANVRDYYQNLVRDLDKSLTEAIGPIRSTSHKDAEGLTKKIEDFQKDLAKHVEAFGKGINKLSGEEKKLADDIMDSKPLSVNAPKSLQPHLSEGQKQEQTDAQVARDNPKEEKKK